MNHFFFNIVILNSRNVQRIMQALTKWLASKDSTLESLYLVDCRLKSNLNDLISELGEFQKLRFLDISGNDIGDFGFNLLSKSLQVNRSLETLIFDRSNVTINAYNNILDALDRFESKIFAFNLNQKLAIFHVLKKLDA
jgi:hypothetical protein